MSWFTECRDDIKSKARSLVKKVTDIKPIVRALGLSVKIDAEIDAAIRMILDDSFLKVMDRVESALNSTIDRTSQELRQFVQQVFDNLLNLEAQLDQILARFFQNIAQTIQDIRTNIVAPLILAISDLERKLFEDINQVIDKIYNYFDGRAEEFKQDLLSIFGFLALPNPSDTCRQKYRLEWTYGNQLTYIDVFNLFECTQLKRLDDDRTTVRAIKEIYATLQLQSFKMTCLGRGSPNFQELYMQKWLDYGKLFEMWQEFDDTMTPQEAYNEAIRRLNQARAEYQAIAADINMAQQTANDAVNRANNAQHVADVAQQTASNAVANSVKNIKFFSVTASNDTTNQISEVVVVFPERVDAGALESILNDGHDMWIGRIDRINETTFKVLFRSARGEGVRWIPSLRFIGIQVER